MAISGRIKNGVVVLDGQANLPEGAEVEVVPRASVPAAEADSEPTLYERLKGAIGMAKGLPADAARNVDHYLYGAPKR